MLKTAIHATVVLLALGASAQAQDSQSEFKLPHISVTGYAHESLRPDYAELTLGVVTERPVAADAVSENATASAAVIADLKTQNIDAKVIRTESVRLEPVLVEDRDPKTNIVRKRTLTGYRASNFIKVKIDKIGRAGAIVSHVVERGANAFRGISFDINDGEAQYDLLRPKAVADAMHRAALYARGASMKLGRLLALDPQADRYDGSEASLPARRVPPPSEVVAIPVEPGLIRLDARVTATWELVPEQ